MQYKIISDKQTQEYISLLLQERDETRTWLIDLSELLNLEPFTFSDVDSWKHLRQKIIQQCEYILMESK